MSGTTPQPLLYRMGITVGQSIAGVANQVKEEVLTQVEQEVITINQQINDLPDPVALSLVFGS